MSATNRDFHVSGNVKSWPQAGSTPGPTAAKTRALKPEGSLKKHVCGAELYFFLVEIVIIFVCNLQLFLFDACYFFI